MSIQILLKGAHVRASTDVRMEGYDMRVVFYDIVTLSKALRNRS